MDLLPAKSILLKTKGSGWFGTDYTINLYKGCHHGCIYCDSRSLCYGIEHFDKVCGKANALAILNRELQQKKEKGVIGAGSMSDPYNAFEKKYCLTQQSLALINTYGFGVSLATKSDLVTRDITKLQQIASHSPVNVSFSLSTINDRLAKKVERNVALPSQRLSAMKALADQGLYTGVVLMPILPYISDDWSSLKQVILRAQQMGAHYIYPLFGMTLRDQQREHYFAFLRKKAPHILKKYEERQNQNYFQPIQNYQQTKGKFEQLCKQVGLETSMEKITANYQKKYQVEQLRLL
jgi:DNA repair photolyase